MKAIDLDQPAQDEEALLKKNPYAYPEWGQNSNGNIIDLTMERDLNKDEPIGKYEDQMSRYVRLLKAQQKEEEPDTGDIYSL